MTTRRGKMNDVAEQLSSMDRELYRGLELIEAGTPEQADRLLTLLTLDRPREPSVWVAAGLCRLRRGRFGAAAAALRMGAWLSGDEVTKELADLCEEVAS
jgi:Flp pilus assembly protein TadD